MAPMNSKNVLLALVMGMVSVGSLHTLEVKAVSPAISQNADVSLMKQIMGSNDSIWDHLRADFSLDHWSSRPSVAAQRDRYLKNAAHIQSIFKRSSTYLYLINEELEKRNLPAELVVLPIIESEYNPTALSPMKASGLWQIMPTTARHLGIVQNQSYDGRNDVYASTQGALNHLTYLNKLYKGDWLLTIAAYNAGEGTINRAIERNRAAGKPTDYWSLNIPFAETRNYVLRFLALSDIIAKAERYNIDLPHVPNRPALVLVKLENQTNLSQAAKVAGVSLQELYAHNPGIKRNASTTPASGPHHLLLPVAKTKPTTTLLTQLTTTKPVAQKVATEVVSKADAATLMAAASAGEGRRVNYRVQQGDSMVKIAGRFSTSVKQLYTWNKQVNTAAHIQPGQLLTIYVK